MRDYIHVTDLARAHILALAATGTEEVSRIYNLGCGGGGYSVSEVIDAAREVTGKEIPERVGPRRAGDPSVSIASSEKIKREIRLATAVTRLACDHRVGLALDAGASERI